jgi:hypothetical protein
MINLALMGLFCKEFQMILLTDYAYNTLKEFNHNEELWVHLQKRASLVQPLMGENPDIKWGFAYYSHRVLSDFSELQRQRNFQEAAQQSIAQKYHMIAVYQGQRTQPLCYVAAPNLDADKLKRDWCKAFAAAHGLRIVRE